MARRSSTPGGQKAANVCRCDPIASAERFPREHRLTRKEQFDNVLANRSAYLRSGCFRVFIAGNAGGGARLGMIVGKRQLKRSVDRNQVKRALRESFRIQRASLPSVDIVIQLAEAPPKESISEQATATWPRVVSAIGTTNDQQSR